MTICKRCHENISPTIGNGRCGNCGTHPDRPVLSRNSSRRRGKVGGKRGNNSGVTNKSKSKGGG